MDSVFKALADPSRRALLDALREEDGQTLSELEAGLAMSRFGVAKHLKALEQAGLMNRVKRGRFTHHYLNAVPLAEALSRWIEPYRVAPAVRGVLDLKARLETPMDDRPDFVMSTYIRCTQDALWDALTDADTLAAYNPFCDQVARRDDRLEYRSGGSEVLVCRETRLDPKTRIESVFEPRWGEDLGASRFVYLIAPQGMHCKLTLEHYDLPVDQRDGVADGWARWMSGLKTFLETGEAERFAPLDEEMAE